MNKRYIIDTVLIFLTIILIMILTIGCKTQYKTIETHSTDTLRIEKIIKINVPQIQTVTIESPCDSLGNLKPIDYTNTSGKVKTSLKNVNGNLVLEVNIDSIQEVWEKEYKSKNFTSDKKEKIIEYKHYKWAWYSLFANILFIGWFLRKPILKLIKPI